MDNSKARKLLRDGKQGELLETDQLVAQMKVGAVFQGFHEPMAELNFPPTYKYDVHSDGYDSSKKMRVPAWTDRILYHVQKMPGTCEVTPLHYTSFQGLRLSDHRPVTASFVLDIQNGQPDGSEAPTSPPRSTPLANPASPISFYTKDQDVEA